MLDRLLYALRRLAPDAGRRLGSWRLSIVLMVLAGFYHGLLAIWATSSPPHVVQNIASLVIFWLVYGLLLINTVACLWRRVPQLRLRRASVVGNYLFHGAFLLLASGFLLTLLARHEASVWVAVGEEFSARPEQFLSQTPPRLLALGVPRVAFKTLRITPEFWGDELLFTELEAELELPGGRRATTRINRPLWSAPWTFLRLSGFGYAPRYELTRAGGGLVDSAFVKVNVFPPGQRDFFQIPRFPHRFYLEVLPDYALEEGEPISRTLNLVHPAVVLRVVRGKADLGSAILGADEHFEFEGLRVGFPEIAYWGQYSIVRDPGIPILFCGYLLGLAGLVLRLGAGRSRARTIEAEGSS